MQHAMASRPAFKLPALHRGAKILLALLVATIVLVALFDWNWLRRPLERYLAHESGREVRIGDLHVALGLNLQPTVRARDVYIENAPWAAARQPFATAGEARFTQLAAAVAQATDRASLMAAARALHEWRRGLVK